MKKKKALINYTNKDFNSIKNDLLEYARIHYPNTYKDFSENSFGSYVLDAVSYVGDQLSFYLDYQVNETFLETAIEYDNIKRMAKNFGYKFRRRPSAYGTATFYVLVPASTSGLGPDPKYIPVLKTGTEVSSEDGTLFVLTENVDFNNASNSIVAARFSSVTGKPTQYAIRAHGQVKSSVLFRTSKTVGAFTRFRRIRIGTGKISEIVSVIDSEGHRYFEVENLSQEVVYTETSNPDVSSDGVRSILKPRIVPRRFVVEQDDTGTYLQFGHGTDEEVTVTDVLDPSQVVLKMSGRNYISNDLFDPTKLLDSNTLGICPSNTTLNIVYESNTQNQINVGFGSLNQIASAIFEFPASDSNDTIIEASVRNTLEVSNEEMIIGGTNVPTAEEIKIRSMGTFAAQGRIVTKNDYETYCYMMPAKFGSVKRANVVADPSFTDNVVNVFVMSENANGQLINTNSTTKNNLKVWLNKNRPLTDRIRIDDAKILNIGFEYEMTVQNNYDKMSVLNSVSRLLKKELSEKLYIGEHFDISSVYRLINKTEGVVDVKNVRMKLAFGENYNTLNLSIKEMLSRDGTKLIPPQNVILEIKDMNRDVKGYVQ